MANVSSGQKLIRKAIAEHGAVTLRCHIETPWTMATIRSLTNAGYKVREVTAPEAGRTFVVTR